MYKNIIFDLGGVMVDFDPKTYLVDRFCNAEVEEQVSQLTFESEEWKLLDAGAAVGEVLWSMDDQPEAYVVIEAGTQPDPADVPKPTPTLDERLAAMESTQTDTDSLVVDQEHRLTMLELGVTPEE